MLQWSSHSGRERTAHFTTPGPDFGRTAFYNTCAARPGENCIFHNTAAVRHEESCIIYNTSAVRHKKKCVCYNVYHPDLWRTAWFTSLLVYFSFLRSDMRRTEHFTTLLQPDIGRTVNFTPLLLAAIEITAHLPTRLQPDVGRTA